MPPKGLSNGVKITYGSRIRQTKSVPLNKTGKQLKEATEVFHSRLSTLSYSQRQDLVDIDTDSSAYYPQMIDGDDGDGDWESLDGAFASYSPGEEGVLQSHAGGEAIFEQMISGLAPGRGDPRVRSARIQETNDRWRAQMPQLIDAYLMFKHEGPATLNEATAWPLTVPSFSEYGLKSFSHADGVSTANTTLLSYGYIGASPEQPVLAFPLHLFEVYRQQHRVCPRFSIDGLARTLHYLHHVPRKSYLGEQISTAYDAYLAIMRGVNARVAVALDRTGDWYMQNVCPPCLYKTIHEPPLIFAVLATIDGNNSLKLVADIFRAGQTRADNRTSTSPRWITPEQVDEYKDEVANAQAKRKKKAPTKAAELPAATAPDPLADPSNVASDNKDDDVAWLNVNELEATELAELETCINTCVERWRAAAPEARNKMFALFAVTGIFVSVCRHGHILAMCDMIRSGELMKYPLAIVRRLFDQYGTDIGLGYDIFCAFWTTLRRSSLGARAVGLHLRGVVPAFHGYAHNRECQLGWHPMYVEGVGLEDFEECERTFAKSNNLASVTRLASAFHRQQQIDEHFDFHDADKHANSGKFIFANYRQAIEKIDMNGQQLAELERQLGTCAADYESYLTAERAYFESKKTEPPEVARTAEYMELLKKLHDAALESRKAKDEYSRMDYYITHRQWQKPEITACTRRYRSSHSRHLGVEEEVVLFEEEHDILERWAPESKEYQDALILMTERKYRRALDKLESLVVKRLFELTKLGMSGVAYKQREKISKALRTRAEAIRTALEQYNHAAAQLNPPRPRLAWTEVVNTVALADFDLLRDTTTDIRNLPWAKPANREAMVLYFGIKRAKEEIHRLNVEIRRTITFMVDDHADYARAIRANQDAAPHLAHELREQLRQRTAINTGIARQFRKTSRLPGFSGTLFPGARVGRDPHLSEAESMPPWAALELGIQREIVEYDEPDEVQPHTTTWDGSDGEDEVLAREADDVEDLVVTFMENLSTMDD
ncbi:hypothetical protein C8R47DRAFT_1230255 [Mycena vitilis]|nr:hypothetical protein C8R47DRAFT_1230255 [Mycena vitilis]